MLRATGAKEKAINDFHAVTFSCVIHDCKIYIARESRENDSAPLAYVQRID